jgi:hypothetical protein
LGDAKLNLPHTFASNPPEQDEDSGDHDAKREASEQSGSALTAVELALGDDGEH